MTLASREVVLAVDGGNTKTVAIVAALDGRILGTASAGCSSIYARPEYSLDPLGELQRAVAGALDVAGAGSDRVRSAVFSLAGADWPDDIDFLRAEIGERLGLPQCAVVNDAIGALRTATPDGVGVSAVCGTSGALGARRSDGAIWYLGFWPRYCGGYALGMRAIQAVEEAGLDLGPATTLVPRLLACHQAADTVELTWLRTRRGARGIPRPSDLAGLVLDEAEAGDPVARQITIDAGRTLGDYAAVCARRLEMFDEPYTLVLAGGLLRHQSRLLYDAIVERHPNAHPVRSLAEPAVGALLSAFDAAGVRHDAADVASTLPPALFASAAETQ